MSSFGLVLTPVDAGISLIGILTGFVVLFGMLASNPLDG